MQENNFCEQVSCKLQPTPFRSGPGIELNKFFVKHRSKFYLKGRSEFADKENNKIIPSQ
jgi:hypothetical protein